MCEMVGSDAGLSVLIVEDDAVAAQCLAILLKHYGHRARVARDGPEALRLAAESAPDVVLLDIGLPGEDGCMVAERLRQQSPVRRPLLVAVTGYGQEADCRRSLEAGIDLHLVKPVEPAVLFGMLRRFGRVIAPAAPFPAPAFAASDEHYFGPPGRASTATSSSVARTQSHEKV
jgi:CheY-like chemotaxis protein